MLSTLREMRSLLGHDMRAISEWSNISNRCKSRTDSLTRVVAPCVCCVMVSSLFLLFVKLITKTVKIICHSVVRDQNTLKMHCSWRMYFLTLFFPGGESRISLEAGLLLAEPAVPCERKQQGLQPPCKRLGRVFSNHWSCSKCQHLETTILSSW